MASALLKSGDTVQEPFTPTDGQPKKTILLVDDDRQLNFALHWILSEEEHFSVQVAHDGESALELIKAHHYDIVVSDMFLPNLRGDELFHAATQVRPALAQCFIIITGVASSETAAFVARTGVECLQKPFPIHRLISSVHRLLAQRPAPGAADPSQ